MNGATPEFEDFISSELDERAAQVSVDGPLARTAADIVAVGNGGWTWPGGRVVFSTATALVLVLAVLALWRAERPVSVEPVSGGAATTEIVVWLEPGFSEDEALEVGRRLIGGPGVVSAAFVDAEQTEADFRGYFADEPELLDLVDPAQLPLSFTVVAEGNPEIYADWAEQIPEVAAAQYAGRR